MRVKESTLDDLLHGVYSRLLKSRSYVTATRGRTREQVGALLQLTNPRARLSHTESRGKLFSAVGELLWYLAGSDKLRFISYYIPKYKTESEDGRTLHGAYGPRLLNHNGINQIESVRQLLSANPSSRRAVIQLFQATDIATPRKEIPCTTTFQFMIRANRLEMVTTMRSNDAFRGLPHDIFAFTMIQEIVARTLGVEIGPYTHFVGSLHLYEENRIAATHYLDEGWQRTREIEMPPMPREDPWPAIAQLTKLESRIRRNELVDLRSINLHDYWLDLVRLLMVFRCTRPQTTQYRIPAIRRQMKSPVFDEFIRMRQPSKRVTPKQPQLSLPFSELQLDGEHNAPAT